VIEGTIEATIDAGGDFGYFRGIMIVTSTPLKISLADRFPANVKAVAVFIAQGESAAPAVVKRADKEVAAGASRLLSAGVATGKGKEIVFDLVGEGSGARRILLAGIGKGEKVTAEVLRQSAGAVLRAIRKQKIGRAAVVLPEVKGITADAVADAIVTGIYLAAFEYREYKGTGSKEDNDEKAGKPIEIFVIGDGSVKKAIERANVICAGQNFARTIASRPANNINPVTLAKEAQALARETGLRCRVMDEKELARLGMGGILAVGAGSIQTPPRMIVLEHRPAKKSSKTLLVVGKAITFDTGGISIKPADKMGKMIFDKCGGMAVLGFMYAAAKLNLPVHVVGILSSAENAISSKAYRPGDILKMYNGVTVDVTNTDAEGRLVLGDALAWGIETYKPAAVVDLATLTGGVIVALGKTMAGVMSNSDSLVKELKDAGEGEGELMWQLPLGKDQRDFIKAEAADIVNSAGREGHPLQGGAFLSYFIPQDDSVPWAHLDIAGVADTEKELPYYAVGATGWGVRTLVRWAEGRAAR
jgi:leucyl aminopeptidase